MKAGQFWAWFREHESWLRAVRSDRERILDVLERKLRGFCTGLYPELSAHIEPVREFIVRAGGNRDLFEQAESLVAEAPQLEGWRFVALKPPMGFDFVSDYEGIRFDPASMLFIRLEQRRAPGVLGLRVYVPNIADEDIGRATRAVWQILETGLGERVCAEEIAHLEVCPLSSGQTPSPHFRLKDASEYLALIRHRRQT